MKQIWEFIVYCLDCMGYAIMCTVGHVQEGDSSKDGLVGVATLFTIAIIILVILLLTGVVSFKK